MTEDGPRTVEDLLPLSFALHRHDLAQAAEDRRYIIQRRDQFSERLLLGSLTLNGASLIATLSVLDNASGVGALLGLSGNLGLYSITCFALGTILAGVSANQRENYYVEECGDAAERVGKLAVLASTATTPLSEESYSEYGSRFEEAGKAKSLGFRFSTASIHLRHWSSGAWAAGILAPLLTCLWEAGHVASWPIWACLGIR